MSLEAFGEIRNVAQTIGADAGGITEPASQTLDVLIGASMKNDFYEFGVRPFRKLWGIEFNGEKLHDRHDMKISFENGDMDAFIDEAKWEGAGNEWSEDSLTLFRKFWTHESPAVYLDQQGRKVNYIDFAFVGFLCILSV